MDFAPGDRVDRYTLVEPLGEGGQGSVWRAEDPLSPGQPRAIKLVPLVLARPNDVERVRREARALARLEHASLVRCHALFEDLKHASLGVVMDFVDGMSLRAAADEPWMTDHHRTMALRHIAGVLAYVHQSGVVHRDLKLDNVLVTREFWDAPDEPQNVKVVDFGIAKVSDGSHALTALNSIVGTIAYLSPELLDPDFFPSKGLHAASDVFAFGVLGCKLLTGVHPTGLASGAGIVDYGARYRTAASQDPPWPAHLPGDAWGDLLADCLRVRVEQRIADGVELARRCGASGEASSGARAALTADPLAPTAEAAVSPDAERAARAMAATQHDAAAPAPRLPEPVVRAEPSGRADTLTSGSSASGAPAGSSKATPIVLTLLLAAGVAGAGWMLLRPSTPPIVPLSSTATVSATASQAPPPPPPSSTAVVLDAPAEAEFIESPTRPADCSADRPICECCPSGRDCGPGSCDDVLNPDEDWHLKLAGGTVADRDIGAKGSDFELCVRHQQAGELPRCTRLSELDAGPTQVFYVSGALFKGRGLEFEVRQGADAGARLRAVFKQSLTRLALCKGFEVEQFTAADGTAVPAKLRFYFDSATSPSEVCR